MARQPADRDHRFGHWKIEDLASLITSIIMFYVGFDVLRDTIQKILSREQTPIDPLGAILGIISAAVMFAVYLYNTRLSKKSKPRLSRQLLRTIFPMLSPRLGRPLLS